MGRKNISFDLANEIEADIVAKKLKPGTKISSVAEMIKKYKISHLTASRIIAELQKRGLVYSLHGKGTFVIDAECSEIKKSHSHQNLNLLCLVNFNEHIDSGLPERASESFRALILQGMNTKCSDYGISLNVLYIPINNSIPVNIEEGIKKKQYDGILAVSIHKAETFLHLVKKYELPLLFLNRYIKKEFCLTNNNFEAGYSSLTYLAQQGIKNPLVIVHSFTHPPPTESIQYFIHKGATEALSDAGIFLKKANVLYTQPNLSLDMSIPEIKNVLKKKIIERLRSGEHDSLFAPSFIENEIVAACKECNISFNDNFKIVTWGGAIDSNNIFDSYNYDYNFLGEYSIDLMKHIVAFPRLSDALVQIKGKLVKSTKTIQTT